MIFVLFFSVFYPIIHTCRISCIVYMCICAVTFRTFSRQQMIELINDRMLAIREIAARKITKLRTDQDFINKNVVDIVEYDVYCKMRI